MRKNWIGRLLMVVLTTLLCCSVAYAAETTELIVEIPTDLIYDGTPKEVKVYVPGDETKSLPTGVTITYRNAVDDIFENAPVDVSDVNPNTNQYNYTADVELSEAARELYTLPNMTEGATGHGYDFTIQPQPVLVTYDSNQFIYDGTAKSPSVVTFYKEGDTTVQYSLPYHLWYYPADGTEALSGAPTDAGSYEVGCTLTTTNYRWGAGAGRYGFTIDKCTLTMPDFEVGGTYTGAEITPTYTLTGTNNKTYDQTSELLTPAYTYAEPESDQYSSAGWPQNAGSYTVTYTLKDTGNFTFGWENETSQDIVSVVKKFSIAPLNLIITKETETFMYNGSHHTPSYTLQDSSDNSHASKSLVNETYFRKISETEYESLTDYYPVDAGTYKVECTPEDAVNYRFSGDVSIEYVIKPATVTITPKADVRPVYDGIDWLHRVFEEGTAANGNSVLINPNLDTVGDIDVWLKSRVDNDADKSLVNAGSYIVQFSLGGDGAGNYVLSDGNGDVNFLEFSVNVAKRTIQVSGPDAALTFTGGDLMPGCFDAYYEDPSYNWQADPDVEKLDLAWELMKDGELVENDEMVGAGRYTVTFMIFVLDDGTVMDPRDLIANYQFDENGATEYETAVEVAPATLELEIMDKSERVFTYGEVISGDAGGYGVEIQLPDGWNGPEADDLLEWIWLAEGPDPFVHGEPIGVGTYEVSCAAAESYKDDVVLVVAGSEEPQESVAFEIVIEPKPITLTLEEQTVDCLPGSDETFAYEVPGLAELGVLASDMENGGVVPVVRYRELGSTGDYSTYNPWTLGIYEVQVTLEGERAGRYALEPTYSMLTVQFAAEGVGAEGTILYLRHGKAYQLGGSGMCWQIKSEQGQVTYRGGTVFYLSPNAAEGDYAFLYIGGGT